MPDNQQRVSLGCGTLILIALIVMIFSNAGNQEVSSLRTEIQQLTGEVQRQSRAIESLERAVRESREGLKPEAEPPAAPPSPEAPR